MRSPCCIFCIALNDNGVFVESIGKGKGGLGFLPGVQIVGLFTSEPFGEGSPNICTVLV